jgi:hypothetical protein
MNLSFSQLERARKNPARFGGNYSGAAGFYNSKNFRTYLLAAISAFHRGDSKQQILSVFEAKSRAKLTLLRDFEVRLAQYKKIIRAYCDGFTSQGCQFVESNKPTSLVLGTHKLKGKIDRFDLKVTGGYRATAGQLHDFDWQSELRWPLIQRAIAHELNCPNSEVEVGVFCFEDGKYEYVSFSDADITAAESEAADVLTTVSMHMQGLP